ncbi:MAG: ATP-binding cassette domain-containing protein [Acidobacteria bacterium]|nr:ATP-binding cassette domain-containing protein [Acidobacteriota bacterium]
MEVISGSSFTSSWPFSWAHREITTTIAIESRRISQHQSNLLEFIIDLSGSLSSKNFPPPALQWPACRGERGVAFADSAAIEAVELVKQFGSLTAVGGVSFAVQPGELFGLLGPNGSGKTTTIHMLCTLLRPTTGTARVNSCDVVAQPLQVRRAIGLVFQETTLDRDLTAYENLLFTAYLHHIPRADAQERILELLKVMELADRRNELVRKLSGGLKRRLDIAQGVLHRPKILFLDEPTIGLDPRSRAAVWGFIGRLRQGGMTILHTTHYLEEAERSDRVGIIDRGKLIALGPPVELKKASNRPSLNEVFLHLTGRKIQESQTE